MFIFLNFLNFPTDNDQVKKIFNELQKEKGCITTYRVLKPRKEVRSGFKAYPFIPFFGGIHYDQDLSGLSDDSIRFFLLHEEGHHIKGHYGYLLRIAICLGGLLFITFSLLFATFFKFVFNINLFQLITAVVISFLLVCFSTSLAVKSLEMDEYESDVYAAEKLRYKCSIEKPSEILKTAFIELNKYLDKYNEKTDSISKIEKICYAINEYHPTDVQRIEYVKYKVEMNQCL